METFDHELGSGCAFDVLITMCKWVPGASQSPSSYKYEWALAVSSAVLDLQQRLLYSDLVSVS